MIYVPRIDLGYGDRRAEDVFSLQTAATAMQPVTLGPSGLGLDDLAVRNAYCVQLRYTHSGVAGPLAAQGDGQICRPFVLGF